MRSFSFCMTVTITFSTTCLSLESISESENLMMVHPFLASIPSLSLSFALPPY